MTWKTSTWNYERCNSVCLDRRNQRKISPIFLVATKCRHKIPILHKYAAKDAKLFETSARPLKVKVYGILTPIPLLSSPHAIIPHLSKSLVWSPKSSPKGLADVVRRTDLDSSPGIGWLPLSGGMQPGQVHLGLTPARLVLVYPSDVHFFHDHCHLYPTSHNPAMARIGRKDFNPTKNITIKVSWKSVYQTVMPHLL